MSDEDIRRAVREVERHGQTLSMINQLLDGLSVEQLSEFAEGLEAKFSKQLPWLDDIESYFFEVIIKDCACAKYDEDGDLISTGSCGIRGCQYGQIYQDNSVFEEAIKATGGLAVNIAWETLEAENDMMMSRAWDALKSKPLFVRHFEIDSQFTKYLVIYPAPP
jgi:hypothetical protein